MKAFLLAAGDGTRLRPLTNNIPKCLVPIRGVPMLDIWLDICRRSGIDEVSINLHAHADKVRAALSGRSGVRITEEPSLLGSAGTVLMNRGWIEDEDCFWVLYADVLTNMDLNRMFVSRSHDITIGVHQIKGDPRRCGVVNFDGDFVVQGFEEKPADPKSNWAFSGVMIATPGILESIPQRFPSDLGFDVLPQYVGRITAYPITEFLTDIGTMENYRAAQTDWPGAA